MGIRGRLKHSTCLKDQEACTADSLNVDCSKCMGQTREEEERRGKGNTWLNGFFKHLEEIGSPQSVCEGPNMLRDDARIRSSGGVMCVMCTVNTVGLETTCVLAPRGQNNTVTLPMLPPLLCFAQISTD